MRLASLVFFPGPSFPSTICLKPRELLTSYMLVLETKAVEGKRRVQVVRCVGQLGPLILPRCPEAVG